MTTIGAYEVERELGKGAMGTVFLARHKTLGVHRAIKVLSGNASSASGERFIREIELLGRVGGTGIVPVHEAGVAEGRPYYVMDLMPGGTLRERLRERGKLPWQEAAAIVRELALALVRCHKMGLVHRDLKPDNVLFDDHGAPRIADFGCARDLQSSDQLTRTGALVGTPHYMAPEQLEGKRADPRADVYALGVILYELVIGSLPYQANTIMALVAAIYSAKRERAKKVGAPAALDLVLDRALQADREKRLDSASALVRGLEEALEPGKPAKRLAIGAGVAALAVALGAAAFVLRGSGSAPPSVAPIAPKAPPVAAPPPPAPVKPAPRVPRGMSVVRDGVYSWKLPAGAIEMVRVAAEKPGDLPLFVGRTEVTLGAFRAFCKASGHDMPEQPEDFPTGDDQPVVGVSWDDARTFCEWGKLRLPTVAEWLRAAGAGDGRAYPWGGDPPDDDRCASKTHRKFGPHPAPVGSFPGGASPCGALDMAGNVREWCQDVDTNDEQKEEISIPSHAVRGGSFMTPDPALHFGGRDSEGTVVHVPDLGFRPVLTDAP